MTTLNNREQCLQTGWSVSQMIEKGSERIWTFSPAWHDTEKVFSKQQMITKIKMSRANILPTPVGFDTSLFLNSQGVKWLLGNMKECMGFGLTISHLILLTKDMTFELVTPLGSIFDHPLTVQVWTCNYNPIAREIASLKVDQQIHMDALEETNKKLNSLYEQMYKEACEEPKESNPEENLREQLRIQTEHIEQIKQIIRGGK